MDKPIAVGDLVVVVKGCPHCSYRLGLTFVVAKMEPSRPAGFMCGGCNADDIHGPCMAVFYSAYRAIPIPWLKRIPPLDELESAKTEEALRVTG